MSTKLINTYHSSLATSLPSTTASVKELKLSNAVFDKSERSFWGAQYNLPYHQGFRGVNLYSKVSDTKAKVSHLDLSSDGSTLAVLSGPRVSLYNVTSTRYLETISKIPVVSSTSDNDMALKPTNKIHTQGLASSCAWCPVNHRLLAVGSSDGAFLVLDTATKSTLRTITLSSVGVKSICWLDGQSLAVGCEDGRVSIVNLADDKPAGVLAGHGDAISSIVVLSKSSSNTNTTTSSKNNHYRLASGSYDHTVRIWDIQLDNKASIRTSSGVVTQMNNIATFRHSDPVLALLPLPITDVNHNADKGSIRFAVAAGNSLYMYNSLNEQKPKKVILQAHSKSISSMSLYHYTKGDNNTTGTTNSNVAPPSVSSSPVFHRIITTSLDSMVKIYDLEGMCVFGAKLSNPCTTFTSNPGRCMLIFGFSSGLINIRIGTKILGAQRQAASIKRKAVDPRGGTYAYFMRGKNFKPSDVQADNDDTLVAAMDIHIPEQEKFKRLKCYDEALKKFKYGKALDEALVTKNPITITALLEELDRRKDVIQNNSNNAASVSLLSCKCNSAIALALSNRDEDELEPILSFLSRYVVHPSYNPRLLMHVTHVLLDLYDGILGTGQCPLVDELVMKLSETIERECSVQIELARVVGQLEGIINASAAAVNE